MAVAAPVVVSASAWASLFLGLLPIVAVVVVFFVEGDDVGGGGGGVG